MKFIRIADNIWPTLYHLTSLDGMKIIYDTNVLKGKEYYNISFTTDKNMDHYVGDKPGTLFKLVIDGNKLVKDYKLEEFQYISDTNIKFNENEIRTKNTNKIENVDNYILGLYFIYGHDFEYRKERLILKYHNNLDERFIYGWTYKDFFNFIDKLKQKYKFFNEPPSVENILNKDNLQYHYFDEFGE